MTPPPEVEELVRQIEGLPRSKGPARDALTLVVERLHLARSPDGRVELYIEGDRESFGGAALGRALEFGEYQEARSERRFEALLVRPSGRDPRVRPMAHVVYEATRALDQNPSLSNANLLALISPYLGLVIDRDLLSLEQQLGLVGEFMFLTELINRAEELGLVSENAVDAWTGWDSASRDFAAPGVAVEAKVTRGTTRKHWVHPMSQLLPAPGETERVYVYSVGISVDRSRVYRLLTAVDRVLDRVDGEARERLIDHLGEYGGVGFDLSHRRQYELEAGFLVTKPAVLVRVDDLRDILRPESFAHARLPNRVADLRYLADLEGLPVAKADERHHVLDGLLRS